MALEHEHRDERADEEELVGERIEDLPEVGDEAAGARAIFPSQWSEIAVTR
jgi:hypothetical protein